MERYPSIHGRVEGYGGVMLMNEQRNPYVGPRVYTYDDRDYFFGREREARDLLARVMSQRLVLFYAQSGAGKSSLINARLIPQLREAGFAVLPVGRVGGELPAGLVEVDNIYLFNLMLSLDQSQGQLDRLARLGLADFLQGLVSEDGLHYAYDPSFGPDVDELTEPYPAVPYVLIIDQFEELITTYPDRLREREDFFRQLNQAMQADPNLWVLLTLREDYLAALDPFACLVRDRLRARFYMQRLSAAAACRAVTKPAARAGRPFAPAVAEALVDDLRQVKLQHPDGTIFTEPGPYVEPVQLQVVCYQLWDNLSPEATEISAADLHAVGDVNQSLADYYADRVAAIRLKSGINERSIRDWVEKQLITATGMRGQVMMEQEESGGLANEAIRLLQGAHLVRAEKRSGATWFELAHDRLVEPVRQDNAAWRRAKLSLLQRQAVLWAEQNRPEGLLLRGAALDGAEAWASDHANYLSPPDIEFLDLCRAYRIRKEQGRARQRKELEMAQNLAAVEKARADAEARIGVRTKRLAVVLAALLLITVVVASVFYNLGREYQAAEDATKAAVASAENQPAVDGQDATATAGAATAAARVIDTTAEAEATDAAATAAPAITTAAAAADAAADAEARATAVAAEAQATAVAAPDQDNDFIAEARAETATAVAATAQANIAEAQTTAAQAIAPPTSPTQADSWTRPKDGAKMVYVPGGTFMMGSDSEDDIPKHEVMLDGFWIDRTEVTYAQFKAFVDDNEGLATVEAQGDGEIYRNGAWQKDSKATWMNPDGTEAEPGDLHPVVQVSWNNALNYCTWAGGQLPTEAQWEYAARGPDNRIYPWGDDWDGSRLNFCDVNCPMPYRDVSQNDHFDTTAPVGTYPDGASWIGAVDMAGNVWEWVADWYGEDYYESSGADDNPAGPESGAEKVIRGGGWSTSNRFVDSVNRNSVPPTERRSNRGFRCVLVPSN